MLGPPYVIEHGLFNCCSLLTNAWKTILTTIIIILIITIIMKYINVKVVDEMNLMYSI